MLASLQARRDRTNVPRHFLARCLAWLAVLVLSATPSLAQELKEPDTSKARVHVGPLSLTPTVELTNLGIDTNVFNEPDGLAKQDFTFTLRPKAEASMNVGRTWLTGSARADVVWYQEYTSERAGNTFYTLGWTVPLNRLAFGVQGSYLRARERPGYEIDTRAQRSEFSGKVAVEYRALAKTFIGVRSGRQRVDYDDTEVYQGTNLSLELNRTVTTAAITVKHQLTPLTANTFDGGSEQDRFEFSPLRDSDSTTAGVQVTFDPYALLKGSARFGYRDFVPVDPSVPKYRGSTAAVDLSYVLQGSTRLTFQFNRDVDYSIDVNQPWYLQTGVVVQVMQQIYGPVDVLVRGGAQNLAYRNRTDVPAAFPERTDRVRSYGAGFGYHVGSDLRIGFTVDKQRRTSEEPFHSYDGLRAGVSVTYGL